VSEKCEKCDAQMVIYDMPGSYETPVAEHLVDGGPCLRAQLAQQQEEIGRLLEEVEWLKGSTPLSAIQLMKLPVATRRKIIRESITPAMIAYYQRVADDDCPPEKAAAAGKG